MTARGGMTVIEVTVALTLVALVVTGGYQLYEIARSVSGRVDASLTELTAESTVRAAISSWLRHPVVHTEETGFYAFDQTWQRIDDDRLLLWVRDPLPGVSGLSRLELFVDREQTTPEEGLVASIEEAGGGRPTRIVVAPTVGRLDFRFGAPTVAEELSSWQSQSRTPRSVVIDMGPRPGLELPPLLSRPWVVTVGEAR